MTAVAPSIVHAWLLFAIVERLNVRDAVPDVELLLWSP